MNLLIFSANWYNRGDESAIRAMIDEIRIAIPDCRIKIHFNQEVESIPYDDIEILKPFIRMDGKNFIKTGFYQGSLRTNGRIPYIGRDAKNFKAYVNAVKWADYAVYAPGGPCIGDYYKVRKVLLDIMELIDRNKVPFSLFAPSVGPFKEDTGRVKAILKKAQILCFRESISQGYFEGILPNKKTYVTLDSAFQHPIDARYYEPFLLVYRELNSFLQSHQKVVGVTITDLMWHRNYSGSGIDGVIQKSFREFLKYIEGKGYAILFIPQLFGKSNDSKYMASFATENSFVMSDQYDCYFQQYIISRLWAVVGMRYHSNIFSAKMGTPFISIAYEQKMQGFMEKAGLERYCMKIDQLSGAKLVSLFEIMEKNYDEYKKFLKGKKEQFRSESYKTTQMLLKDMGKVCGE